MKSLLTSNIIHEVAQAIKNAILNVEAQMKVFEDAFVNLQGRFQNHMAVCTQLAVLKLHEDLHDLGELPDFPPESVIYYAVSNRRKGRFSRFGLRCRC